MIKKAFPPIVDGSSTILILGTMPGEKSLEQQQYYGHRQNHFWPLMFGIFDLPVPESYEAKVNLLTTKGIALWDVLIECKREGSSDSNIQEEVVNDFASFYKQYPKIHSVFWDSLTAQKLYLKHVGKTSDKEYYLLPSPSPRYARLRFDAKLEQWRKVAQLAEGRG